MLLEKADFERHVARLFSYFEDGFYAHKGWQRIALDRDDYDHSRMPRALFDAILEGSAPPEQETLFLYATTFRASEMGAYGESLQLQFSWHEYTNFMFDRACYAEEIFLFSTSQTWCVYCDFDVTIFSASDEIFSNVTSKVAFPENIFSELSTIAR